MMNIEPKRLDMDRRGLLAQEFVQLRDEFARCVR